MPTILCYGDSNTWGYPPGTGERAPVRYPLSRRWPGVMQAALGSGYSIVENGLPGRTSAMDDPVEGAYRNGMTHLPVALGVAAPIDLIILMLGTNDLKTRFNATSDQIANNVGTLVEIVRERMGIAMPVLVICPPRVTETRLPAWSFAGAAERSKKLPQAFARMAVEKQVPWLDAGEFVVSSEIDGVHLDESAHQLLGEVIADKVRELI